MQTLDTREADVEVDNVLLAGIVGSTAYGLATPESDIDRLGVYAAPTVAFHGLHPPIGKKASKVSTDPDVTFHEAGKWAHLAMSCNPTASELVWLPGELYETRTPLGDDLIAIRTAFLSAGRVRDAYLGYAVSQFKRLENRGDGSFSADTRKRTAKHARHLWRLVTQGEQLYATGRLPIRLDDPEGVRAFGERVADGAIEEARERLAAAEQRFDEIRTPLPERPDEDTVERWLHAVRAAHYAEPAQRR
ncbi:nucleotidyltransferase domain-containing protein [Actinomadura barringtoniae]|uniref:Nucleotidyltransferase domain-containing protein n=1 Tax=Actinomadura barringtoniae TaxID=1427535 RepID=A0A939PRY3_9ACTN|nr:nucleotidyltransferase domain-containing protein [Actinomadura barringtoniae]